MESGFTSLITTMVLKAAIIVIALMIALNKTKKLSGDAGAYAAKMGGAALLGGTAIVGRRLIGGTAKSLQDSAAMKRFIARTGVAGELLDRGIGATAKGSMDIRGLPGVEGFGKAGGKGGYDKYLKDQTKRKVELGKRLEKDKLGKSVEMRWREKVIDPDTGLHTGEYKEEAVTAKEYYTRKLEREKPFTYLAKKEGYKQARADRDAAKELRKKKSKKEELWDEMQKAAKEDMENETKEKPPKEDGGGNEKK